MRTKHDVADDWWDVHEDDKRQILDWMNSCGIDTEETPIQAIELTNEGEVELTVVELEECESHRSVHMFSTRRVRVPVPTSPPPCFFNPRMNNE